MKNKQEVQQEAAKKLEQMMRYDWQEGFIRRHKLEVSQATLSRWLSGQQAIPLHVLVHLGIVEIK